MLEGRQEGSPNFLYQNKKRLKIIALTVFATTTTTTTTTTTKIQENFENKSKIFEKSKNFRKFSRGPPRVPQGPPRGHGKFFVFLWIIRFFLIFFSNFLGFSTTTTTTTKNAKNPGLFRTTPETALPEFVKSKFPIKNPSI